MTAGPSAPSPPAPTIAAELDDQAWRSLFDGKTLDGWKKTNFGGEGDILVDDGKLVVEMGYPLSGVTFDGDVESLPKTNYEVRLEAMRMEGGDFFCGLTFPVADSHCSFIVGGWAGGVVGLSSLNGMDASENETTRYREFKSNQWYKVRVRVTPERLQAWIDEESFADVDIRDKKVTTRVEVDPSQPLGIATYETKAALRNIQIRRLPAE